ncbi:MAG: ribulose-phosphate 3-epimerase [Deltaproteobacteria bacterium]|nr:ribulose-phosphate 3-epimerase [Deltaproteobacteria bacterium]
MKKLAPSILSADFARLGEEIRAVEAAGADLIHVDVADGHFVPNITVGVPVVEAIRPITALELDVHLMIAAPERYLDAFMDAGGDIITVHAEAGPHVHRLIQRIRERGKKAGVSLNPGTPLSSLDHVLAEVDLVLLMSVNPGFGGQRFIRSMLPKIAALRERIDRERHRALIEVDGGVKVDNAAEIARAGADILVAGSAIFGSGDVAGAVKRLKEAIAR